MSELYIHYGSNQFNTEKFQQIKNCFWIKPEGGLWASRVDDPYSWKQWCLLNDHKCESITSCNYFTFKLAPNARVLEIKSIIDVDALPLCKLPDLFTSSKIPILPQFKLIDFEKLSTTYDAIELRLSEDERLYKYMYGWDCNCILVMNKDVIEL